MYFDREKEFMKDLNNFKICKFIIKCFDNNANIYTYREINSIMTKSFLKHLRISEENANDINNVYGFFVDKKNILNITMLFYDERDSQIFIDKLITNNLHFLELEKKLNAFAESIVR